jgi:hypothetical protein
VYFCYIAYHIGLVLKKTPSSRFFLSATGKFLREFCLDDDLFEVIPKKVTHRINKKKPPGPYANINVMSLGVSLGVNDTERFIF